MKIVGIIELKAVVENYLLNQEREMKMDLFN